MASINNSEDHVGDEANDGNNSDLDRFYSSPIDAEASIFLKLKINWSHIINIILYIYLLYHLFI